MVEKQGQETMLRRHYVQCTAVLEYLGYSEYRAIVGHVMMRSLMG